LPTRLSDIAGELPGPEGLLELMAQDKKVKRGKLALILARGIGSAFIESDVDQAEIQAFLAEQLSAP
jgi:3-dehydroquinate synthetase